MMRVHIVVLLSLVAGSTAFFPDFGIPSLFPNGGLFSGPAPSPVKPKASSSSIWNTFGFPTFGDVHHPIADVRDYDRNGHYDGHGENHGPGYTEEVHFGHDDYRKGGDGIDVSVEKIGNGGRYEASYSVETSKGYNGAQNPLSNIGGFGPIIPDVQKMFQDVHKAVNNVHKDIHQTVRNVEHLASKNSHTDAHAPGIKEDVHFGLNDYRKGGDGIDVSVSKVGPGVRSSYSLETSNVHSGIHNIVNNLPTVGGLGHAIPDVKEIVSDVHKAIPSIGGFHHVIPDVKKIVDNVHKSIPSIGGLHHAIPDVKKIVDNVHKAIPDVKDIVDDVHKAVNFGGLHHVIPEVKKIFSDVHKAIPSIGGLHHAIPDVKKIVNNVHKAIPDVKDIVDDVHKAFNFRGLHHVIPDVKEIVNNVHKNIPDVKDIVEDVHEAVNKVHNNVHNTIEEVEKNVHQADKYDHEVKEEVRFGLDDYRRGGEGIDVSVEKVGPGFKYEASYEVNGIKFPTVADVSNLLKPVVDPLDRPVEKLYDEKVDESKNYRPDHVEPNYRPSSIEYHAEPDYVEKPVKQPVHQPAYEPSEEQHKTHKQTAVKFGYNDYRPAVHIPHAHRVPKVPHSPEIYHPSGVEHAVNYVKEQVESINHHATVNVPKPKKLSRKEKRRRQQARKAAKKAGTFVKKNRRISWGLRPIWNRWPSTKYSWDGIYWRPDHLINHERYH